MSKADTHGDMVLQRAATLLTTASSAVQCCRPSDDCSIIYPIGSMYVIYGNNLPSIYPSHVSIYTSTMDPMGTIRKKF